MALLEPVPTPHHSELGHVHFIGIGGASMSGIAEMMVRLGHPVSGSDANDSTALTRLAELGVEVHVGHSPDWVAGADSVVVTSALRPDNPELLAARDRGLPVLHRSVALASLTTHQRNTAVIAVTGTHGKTTTAAWTAVALAALGRDPSYVIGAPIAESGVLPADSFARLGRGPDFVVEADESDGTFRQYPARIVVVTNVEADHLDNWGTPQHYAAGFDQVVTGGQVEVALINADDPGARALASRVAGQVRVVTYGEADDADVRLSEIEITDRRSTARISFDQTGGVFRTPLLGRHNLANAAAAYAVSRILGVGDPQARLALARFAGTARRFQLIGEANQVRVYDDYAHNPTKVRSALQGARIAAGRGRLVVCFQPHLYSRTRDFAAQFAEALSLADEVVVTDIFPAREDPIPGVSSDLIADQVHTVRGRAAHRVGDLAEAVRVTARLARPWDVVMTVGAGSVTTIAPKILALLQES